MPDVSIDPAKHDEAKKAGTRAGVESLVGAALDDLGDLRRKIALGAMPTEEARPPQQAATPLPPESQPYTGSVPCAICPQPEGVDNCCGQVAIGTVLSAHGRPVDPADLQRTNPAGIFTSPSAIVSFLNDRCGAVQHNGGSLHDLRRELDAGRPVIVLVNADSVPHWVTVTGYTSDSSGRVSGIKVTDHVIGAPSRTLGADDFERIWASPLEGTPGLRSLTNYRNVWIQTGIRSSPFTGHPFSTATEDLVGSALNKLVSGWCTADVPRIFSGIVEGLFGLAGSLNRLPGQILGALGERLAGWASDRLARGGALNYLAGSFCWITAQAMNGAGTVLSAVGNGISTVGRWVGAGAERAGSYLASLWPF